ncbi:hypothetical protein FEM48_Zijuj01G0077200 [Ziziphus jujuba var. spinosa]|uniref:Uncharacterized protein n=1 Tax=Ziziphus jujuba var. spinosa TaxID=714518 RepID=A0A978VZZ9_ZIZJJ|nr:hypothetical protein FEM48_Zijuj01G0077200 [Ziziphus jujuba var. spinosa]
MKKLYRKGTVHPSPPIISDHLSFLPAAILTLTVALSPEDREVLAYLISCSNSAGVNSSSSGQRRTTQRSCGKGGVAGATSSSSSGGGGDHPPQFNCNCFRCYTSFWVRWDSSPNRQLIHEIIDAFEDGLLAQSKGAKNNNNRKERRKRGGGGGGGNNGSGELKRSELSSGKDELVESESVVEETSSGGGDGVGDEEAEKGSVRRFVSFIGERIWGVWNE